jgi:hypothetical protein
VKSILLGLAVFAAGCASTSTAVKVGNNTYMMSATGSASPFGLYSDADNIKLVQSATQQCAAKGQQFELIKDEQSPTSPGHRGTATVTFRCVS